MADDPNAHAIDRFYKQLTLGKIQTLATYRRRGAVYHITIRHCVGWGGSRVFKVKGVSTPEEAMRALHRHLATATGVPPT